MIDFIISTILFILVVTIPGYAIALAFFTKKGEIDLIERLTFSLLFSIIFPPILILIENQLLGIPLNFISVAGTEIFLILISLLVYSARIKRINAPKIFYKYIPAVNEKDAVELIPKIR
ncbi:MAG: hypothetical protein ABID38_03045 [Candidatus Diapherotrites archaeon]